MSETRPPDAARIEHLYVHVPFCASICAYCAFYSEKARGRDADRWLVAVDRELAWFAPRLAPRTIFMGGGTPSVLTTRQLARLVESLERRLPGYASCLDEWTVEMNPGTVSPEKARLLREAGVTRISMGVQSLDDCWLERLGRTHTVRTARASLEVIRAAGFETINIDLMFALPGQTLPEWRETLRRAAGWATPHLSAYELTYEEDTPLTGEFRAGRVSPADEATSLAMQAATADILAGHGLLQYEISNYALPGFECRHHLNTWRGGEYLGVGPGAHGYVDGRRYRNLANTAVYCRRIECGESPVDFEERLGVSERAGELVAFALRMNDGLTAAELRGRTGFGLGDLWPGELTALQAEGLVDWDGERLRLTARGRPVADAVAEVFLAPGLPAATGALSLAAGLPDG